MGIYTMKNESKGLTKDDDGNPIDHSSRQEDLAKSNNSLPGLSSQKSLHPVATTESISQFVSNSPAETDFPSESGQNPAVLAMKQLTLIVKPFRAEAVLRALIELGIHIWVVREAKGYSRQKGYLEQYIGSEYSLAFLPKVEITVWITDQQANEIADQLVNIARTGRIGDGKVFVVPTAWPGSLDF